MPNSLVFDDSVIALKKTIPLMMKYNIPVVPQNYALWYSYVLNNNPALNKEMDTMLSVKPTFSSFDTNSIYDKHFKSEDFKKSETLQNTIETVASSISDSIGFTKEGAQQFEQAMDSYHEQLSGMHCDAEHAEHTEQISDFVGDLISKSLQMRDNAKGFGESLDNAQDEIKQLREKLESSRKEALQDELTGLFNRRAFNDDLSQAIDSGMLDTSLIIVDIDHFKQFNDTHGHLLGDQVLKVVAKRLEVFGDIKASAYRYGGEEFAVLVEEGGISRAIELAQSLRQSIERLVIKDKKSQKKVAKITCSFGVAQLTPQLDTFSLIELADSRLYRAKEAGRNQVIFD